jgi:hypothetical protein
LRRLKNVRNISAFFIKVRKQITLPNVILNRLCAARPTTSSAAPRRLLRKRNDLKYILRLRIALGAKRADQHAW